MGFYLIQVGYTVGAENALVDHPQNREEAARKAIKSVGGKMHSFHFAFGEYDVVIVAEMPNNVAAAAVAMATTARGALSKFHTTTLLTSEEGMEAMKMAKKVTYAPQA